MATYANLKMVKVKAVDNVDVINMYKQQLTLSQQMNNQSIQHLINRNPATHFDQEPSKIG